MQPFRFVHASDLHLDRPLSGIAAPPAHLTDVMIDAPYVAARRVFDTAINQRADFLILAGDVVDVLRAGPRAAAFLIEQFERLAAANIAVNWLSARAERRGPFPAELPLPPNVHVWRPGPAQPIVHQADGDSLCMLVAHCGAESPERLEAAAKTRAGLFTIGVWHGRFEREQKTRRAKKGEGSAKSSIDYWACGGSHRRRRLRAGNVPMIYSGSPQGRSPAECGSHGAVVVDVNDQGIAQPRFIPTDDARYVQVRAAINPSAPQNEQEHAVAERLDAERARAGGNDLFLCWQLAQTGAATTDLARAFSSDAWLTWLRREFGAASPAAWSVSVDIASPATVASATVTPQDGSLLAEFLAEAAASKTSAAARSVEPLIPAPLRGTGLAAALAASDAGQNRRVWQRAVALGRELLGAEEAPR